MGMKRLLMLVPVALVLGCNARDKADVELNAAVAYNSAKEAIGTAWSSVSAEVGKVTADSSKKALEEARKQAENLQTELSKIEIKNPLSEAQMDVAREQIAKVNAALRLQNLKAQSEDAVQKAIDSGKVMQQSYEDASKRLAELDEDYRNLKGRMDEAQAAYDQAAMLLSQAVEKAKELSGIK